MGRPGRIAAAQPVIRALTSGERALAYGVFGDRLALDRVRIFGAPWPVFLAFVPGRWFGRDWIVWPRAQMHADFANAPLNAQAVLIHELVHVWQAQTGTNLLRAKLRAGFSAAAYVYPVDDGCNWDKLNIEQQAMVVQHRFMAGRRARVPGGRDFYDRVCPFPDAGKI
jgi:hypothetical protein